MRLAPIARWRDEIDQAMNSARSVTSETVLRLRGITKRFGSLVANRGVSLELRRGEVLALLGENGAGKSTLVSILFGRCAADEGEIEVFGRRLAPGRPSAALAAGIGLIPRDFALAENLTVLDNILIGTKPWWALASRRRAAQARIEELARRLGLAVHLAAWVGKLSLGERQRVEILKAMYRGARVLILDEPTAVLAPRESSDLFGTLRRLADGGLAVLFTSHKPDEVLEVSDCVAVLRRGELVAELAAAGADGKRLAGIMAGREIVLPSRREQGGPPEGAKETLEPLLRLHRIRAQPECGGAPLRGVSLKVFSGEIVAVAGVAGNGLDALVDVLFGSLAPHSGRAELAGRAWPASPRAAVRSGLGRVPGDWQGLGTIGDLPVWENAVLETYADRRFATFGFRRRGAARRQAEEIMREFNLRPMGLDAPARTLSGGSRQKLILGRVLRGNPRVIVANQPTRDLDLEAVAEVRARLLAARAAGTGILLLTEDTAEAFALADRIGVMHRGELIEPKPSAEWNSAAIGLAMTGAAALSP